MKKFFGYIRVSTARQGEQGVSLEAQRDAIAAHAQRQSLTVAQWFEERVTAAKRGRPVFTQMLRLLRQGKAAGVLIHKIDRGARNLKDWADLGELIDAGIEVHFANESLDLQSRGGRLSADIQAVVAADYIRNLREETRKGFYGRIKQGLFPLPAPIGYLDCGKGKVKEVDPDRGPLIRRAFELYGTGRYTLEGLRDEMYRLGLRTKRHRAVPLNGFSILLKNPFYIGLIKLKRTGEIFPGAHEPLIQKALFDLVQRILTGKTNAAGYIHDFLFRRLLACKGCGYSLIGERQKGTVYYRCHTKACPTTSVREESVSRTLAEALALLEFNVQERAFFTSYLLHLRKNWASEQAEQEQTLTLRLSRLQDRLARLTDAFLDGILEKPLFEDRKAAILLERKDVEEQLGHLRHPAQALPERLGEFLELAWSASRLYEFSLPEERRELLKVVTSNRWVTGKNVEVVLAQPFREVAEWAISSHGAPFRDRPRTVWKLAHRLSRWFAKNPAPVPWAAFTHSSEDKAAGMDRKDGLLAA